MFCLGSIVSDKSTFITECAKISMLCNLSACKIMSNYAVQ
jgi:hypothetical protein